MGSVLLLDQFRRLEDAPTPESDPFTGKFGKIEAGAEELVVPLKSDPVTDLAEIRELAFRVACITGERDGKAPDLPIRLEFRLEHRDIEYPLNYAGVPGGFDLRAVANEVSMRTTRQNIVGVLVHSYNISLAGGVSIFLEPGEQLTIRARRHLKVGPAEDPLVEAHLYAGPLFFALECMGLDGVQITPRRHRRRRKYLEESNRDLEVLLLGEGDREDV